MVTVLDDDSASYDVRLTRPLSKGETARLIPQLPRNTGFQIEPVSLEWTEQDWDERKSFTVKVSDTEQRIVDSIHVKHQFVVYAGGRSMPLDEIAPIQLTAIETVKAIFYAQVIRVDEEKAVIELKPDLDPIGSVRIHARETSPFIHFQPRQLQWSASNSQQPLRFEVSWNESVLGEMENVGELLDGLISVSSDRRFNEATFVVKEVVDHRQSARVTSSILEPVTSQLVRLRMDRIEECIHTTTENRFLEHGSAARNSEFLLDLVDSTARHRQATTQNFVNRLQLSERLKMCAGQERSTTRIRSVADIQSQLRVNYVGGLVKFGRHVIGVDVGTVTGELEHQFPNQTATDVLLVDRSLTPYYAHSSANGNRKMWLMTGLSNGAVHLQLEDLGEVPYELSTKMLAVGSDWRLPTKLNFSIRSSSWFAASDAISQRIDHAHIDARSSGGRVELQTHWSNQINQSIVVKGRAAAGLLFDSVLPQHAWESNGHFTIAQSRLGIQAKITYRAIQTVNAQYSETGIGFELSTGEATSHQRITIRTGLSPELRTGTSLHTQTHLFNHSSVHSRGVDWAVAYDGVNREFSTNWKYKPSLEFASDRLNNATGMRFANLLEFSDILDLKTQVQIQPADKGVKSSVMFEGKMTF